jgi:hypothetical protein
VLLARFRAAWEEYWGNPYQTPLMREPADESADVDITFPGAIPATDSGFVQGDFLPVPSFVRSWLYPHLNHILVREEYGQIYEYLEVLHGAYKPLEPMRKPIAVIAGQPGIGACQFSHRRISADRLGSQAKPALFSMRCRDVFPTSRTPSIPQGKNGSISLQMELNISTLRSASGAAQLSGRL